MESDWNLQTRLHNLFLFLNQTMLFLSCDKLEMNGAKGLSITSLFVIILVITK